MMEILAVFLPLVGAALAGVIVFMPQADKHKQHTMDTLAQWITCSGLVLSAICAVILFNDVALNGNARVTELFTWIDSGSLEVSWALRVDQLTAVMMIVVTGVSAMVHIYACGYMHHDKSIPRFM
ncbi:MAG: NADH-quinone oxidoreductase subunit L, partial [Rhodospirillales bacterium]